MSVDWLATPIHHASDDEIRRTLNDTGTVRIRQFPADAATLIDFVSFLGTPLAYYGDNAGTHPDHPAIWRVQFDHDASLRGETHAVDGELPVHSSQSMLDLRPRYFGMLMVDPGWQNQPAGRNGESLLVAWADVIRQLSLDHPADHDEQLAVLQSGVPWPDGNNRPIIYRLPDQRDEFDFGVRLKSDLLTHLQATRPDDAVTRTVNLFTDTARKVARRVQLNAHDLLLVDNDRWGHGRESITGRVRTDANWSTNPRELWSFTLA